MQGSEQAADIAVAFTAGRPGLNSKGNRMNGMLRTLAVAGTLLAGLVLPASAQAYYAVTEGAVNMRTGPGVTYARITTVPAGVQVWVSDCAPRWCSITWRNKSGWVAASLLSGGHSVSPVYPNDYYDNYGNYDDDYCYDYSYPDCWPGGGGGYYYRHHHRHHHHHDGDHKPPKDWKPGKPWHPDNQNGPNNYHPNFENNNHPNFPRSFDRSNNAPLFHAPSNGGGGDGPRFFDRSGPGPGRSGPPGGGGGGGGGNGGDGGHDWNRGH
jgi:uncharacterized protein YraI